MSQNILDFLPLICILNFDFSISHCVAHTHSREFWNRIMNKSEKLGILFVLKPVYFVSKFTCTLPLTHRYIKKQAIEVYFSKKVSLLSVLIIVLFDIKSLVQLFSLTKTIFSNTSLDAGMLYDTLLTFSQNCFTIQLFIFLYLILEIFQKL